MHARARFMHGPRGVGVAVIVDGEVTAVEVCPFDTATTASTEAWCVRRCVALLIQVLRRCARISVAVHESPSGGGCGVYAVAAARAIRMHARPDFHNWAQI